MQGIIESTILKSTQIVTFLSILKQTLKVNILSIFLKQNLYLKKKFDLNNDCLCICFILEF